MCPLEIREQLGRVDGQQFFNCLRFNDHAVFDEEVDAVCGNEVDSLINNRQRDLVPEMQAVDSELVKHPPNKQRMGL